MCTDEIADGEYRLNKKAELQGNAKNYIEEDETAEENLNEYRNRRKVWHGWSQAKWVFQELSLSFHSDGMNVSSKRNREENLLCRFSVSWTLWRETGNVLGCMSSI